MSSPVSIFPASRRRHAALAELRRLLPRLEGTPARALAFGLPELDGHLPQGGLACGALHEIIPDEGERPAALGFSVAVLSRLPADRPVLLVIAPKGLGDNGRIHGHGLNGLGLDPARLILVETGSEELALWALEEALRSGAPAAVAGAIGKPLAFKVSQRLQLAARSASLPLVLMLPPGTAGSSAAATRWRIACAAAPRDRFGLLDGWCWRVCLERCRNGRTGEWLLEWDHVAHRFRLAAALADTASASEATGDRDRLAGALRRAARS